jgi:hypothetical protein
MGCAPTQEHNATLRPKVTYQQPHCAIPKEESSGYTTPTQERAEATIETDMQEAGHRPEPSRGKQGTRPQQREAEGSLAPTAWQRSTYMPTCQAPPHQ